MHKTTALFSDTDPPLRIVIHIIPKDHPQTTAAFSLDFPVIPEVIHIIHIFSSVDNYCLEKHLFCELIRILRFSVGPPLFSLDFFRRLVPPFSDSLPTFSSLFCCQTTSSFFLICLVIFL